MNAQQLVEALGIPSEDDELKAGVMAGPDMEEIEFQQKVNEILTHFTDNVKRTIANAKRSGGLSGSEKVWPLVSACIYLTANNQKSEGAAKIIKNLKYFV